MAVMTNPSGSDILDASTPEATVAKKELTASEMGRMGGKTKSEAKARAARENAMLGGRPVRTLAKRLGAKRAKGESEHGFWVESTAPMELYVPCTLKAGTRIRALKRRAGAWEFIASANGGKTWFKVRSDTKPEIEMG